jgi:hypothetical protein
VNGSDGRPAIRVKSGRFSSKQLTSGQSKTPSVLADGVVFFSRSVSNTPPVEPPELSALPTADGALWQLHRDVFQVAQLLSQISDANHHISGRVAPMNALPISRNLVS